MYTPHRSGRYFYVAELIEDMEKRLCSTCIHRTEDPDMPMCMILAGAAVLEQPIAEWEERPDGLVACNEWSFDELAPISFG